MTAQNSSNLQVRFENYRWQVENYTLDDFILCRRIKMDARCEKSASLNVRTIAR